MLSNKDGQMTNGIYGFLLTMQKLLVEVKPDRVAIAFDLSCPTFRHKMYAGYKATRNKMPDELASQLPILKRLLNAMGYKMIVCEGYEADDILGTFADYCEKNKYECILATGDRDILQLVSNNVYVKIASTKFGKTQSTLYDVNKVKEEYGVSPERLVDVKALQGDTSDNIPGVKGVGPKTATDLISKFGSIKSIYNNIESLDIKSNLKSKLLENKDMAFLSYELGKIKRNIPIDIHEKDYLPREMDIYTVKEMLTELEFFSLLNKLDFKSSSEDTISITVENLDKITKDDLKTKTLSFVVKMEEFKITKLFMFHSNKVYVIDCNQKNFYETLKYVMTSDDIEKTSYNFKNLERALELEHIDIKGPYFDIMLASYLLTPSEKDYDVFNLASLYNVEIPKIIFQNEELKNLENESFSRQVYIMSKLKPILESKIVENKQKDLLEKIEQPLSKVLANMENIGFLIDKNGLELYGEELEKELKVIQNSIYDISGIEFNINSPKQLGTVLFERLNLPKSRKTKNGYSTNAKVLEDLIGSHEIIEKILNYRTLSKLKSTYCDGLIKLISPSGRIHSSFNQTETRTGRISSTEPNLQNIPIRTDRGKKLRKFFKAPENCVLIDADYSQIELRVLAHISQDANMIKAFKNKEDIHSITASEILGIPLDMVTPEMRFKAKAVNFGILYGMGAFSLSKDLKISHFEAQNYINLYLLHYKGVDEYMHKIIEKSRENGYAETLFLRRRYLPELNSSNHMLRAFGERVARNMPIQGTSADIIKIAMINIFEKLKNKKSKLILQVHDELIIESPMDEVDEVKYVLKNEMENAVKLSVPLEVNVNVGKTWFDAQH